MSCGRISLLLLMVNVVVIVPLLLMVFLPTRFVYHVTTWPVEKEVVESILDYDSKNLSYSKEVKRTFDRSRNKGEETFLIDLNHIQGYKELMEGGTGDVSTLFPYSNVDGRPTVKSSATSFSSAERLNILILSELASEYHIEAESEIIEDRNIWVDLGIRLTAISIWVVFLPSLGYWLFIAFFRSDKIESLQNNSG